MEEVKNHEKKERSCFRHCLSGHCQNCGWGHKIAKILIALVIVGALICVGVALGSRNNRFTDRDDLMMNSFYQGRFAERGDFGGGCGRKNDSGEFRQRNCPLNNQVNNREFGSGCGQEANCGNLNCPLNQVNQVNPTAVPNSPTPFSPISTSTSPLQ